MLTILLLVLVVLALGGGYWGQRSPRFGYASWSPLGIVLVVVVLLLLTGNLRGLQLH